MPGIVVFKRRWSVGSDDIIIPALLLILAHGLQSCILISTLVLLSRTKANETALYEATDNYSGVANDNSSVVESNSYHRLITDPCSFSLYVYSSVYLGLLCLCLIDEAVTAWMSYRGGILQVQQRTLVEYLLYIRLVLFCAEVAWLVVGMVHIIKLRFLEPCNVSSTTVTTAVVGINFALTLTGLLSVWCVFDSAGRSWVKMRRYQTSFRSAPNSNQQRRRRTGSSRRRNLRNRHAMMQYERIWDRRFRHLFCCLSSDDRSAQNTFADVAKLFSDFFRDLDVVPSDIIAGLLLLRQYQKDRSRQLMAERSQHVLHLMSGRPIYSTTRFLDPGERLDRDHFDKVVHFMKYSLAAYGCPMLAYTTNCFCLLCKLWSCGSRGFSEHGGDCCCGPAAGIEALLHEHGLPDTDFQITYLYKNVEVEQTPFFVAVDHRYQAIVVAIRGTLSLHDVLTDLRADCECIPCTPAKEDWFGHKGIVRAAVNIVERLSKDKVIEFALSEPGCSTYSIMLTGHSLGAGTAAVLGLLLRPLYGNRLQVLAYSPPGGLLSLPAAIHSRQFMTSVIIGKDVVPRIGLPQLEVLRADLIRVIMHSCTPKWGIIAGSLCCCTCNTGEGQDLNIESIHQTPIPKRAPFGNSASRDTTSEPLMMCQTVSGPLTGSCSACVRTSERVNEDREEHLQRSRVSKVPLSLHPTHPDLELSTHNPLYLPGNILHVVRSKKEVSRCFGKTTHPIFHAIWADYTDFDEVLVSPSMIQDHMPDYVLESLERVLTDYDEIAGVPNKEDHEDDDARVVSMDFVGTSATNEGVPRTPIFEGSNRRSQNSLNSSSLPRFGRKSSQSGFSNENSPNPTRLIRTSLPRNSVPISTDSTASSVIMMDDRDVKDVLYLDSDMETSHDADSPDFLYMQRKRLACPWMHHSNTMPASLDAPIATPEAWSMSSLESDCLSHCSSIVRHTNNIQQNLLYRPRPVSDYCSYCYYIFPDEEPSRPFDGILPKPRMLFSAGINGATASLDRQRLTRSMSNKDKDVVSSTCTTDDIPLSHTELLSSVAPSVVGSNGSGTITPTSPMSSDLEDSLPRPVSWTLPDEIEEVEQTPRAVRQKSPFKIKNSNLGDSYDSLLDGGVDLPNGHTKQCDRYLTIDSDTSEFSTDTVIAFEAIARKDSDNLSQISGLV